MSTERILIHGTTAQRMGTTPALGQIGSDDDTKQVILGDGSTVGGIPMAKESQLPDGARLLPVPSEGDVGKAPVVNEGEDGFELAPVMATSIYDPQGKEADVFEAIDTATDIHGRASKTTPVGTDELRISDSEDGWSFKKLSWSNILAAIKSFFNASGNAPVYAIRAWVSFNGTGTIAIRGSGNVSSITDIGTGDYAVRFTTDMPDANYSASVVTSSENPRLAGFTTKTTDTLRVRVYNSTFALTDETDICVTITR